MSLVFLSLSDSRPPVLLRLVPLLLLAAPTLGAHRKQAGLFHSKDGTDNHDSSLPSYRVFQEPSCRPVGHTQFPRCAGDSPDFAGGRSIAIKEDAEAWSSIFTEKVLVAEKSSCSVLPVQHNTTEDGRIAGNGGNYMRLIVDAQHVSQPRCCTEKEAQGLSGKSLHSKKLDAILDRGTAAGVDFVVVWPLSYAARCSESSPCPLVIQIAEQGNVVNGIGNPWLLMQAECTACRRELHTVLVAPALDMENVTSKDGSTLRTLTSQTIGSILLPFVKTFLDEHVSLDKGQVYLVAQGRGIDLSFRAALLAPHLFKMLILSGMYKVSDETLHMLHNTTLLENLSQGRLHSIHFHIGDQDSSRNGSMFFTNLRKAVEPFTHYKQPRVQLRVHSGSKRGVWFTAHNIMHDVLWNSLKVPETMDAVTPVSCKPSVSTPKPPGASSALPVATRTSAFSLSSSHYVPKWPLVPLYDGGCSNCSETATPSSASPNATENNAELAAEWLNFNGPTSSTRTGNVTRDCQTVVAETQPRLCTLEQVGAYKNLSHIFAWNPEKIQDVFSETLLLSDEDPEATLSHCRWPGAESAVLNPVRFILDTKYVNAPRCCKETSWPFLVESHRSLASEFVQAATEAVQWLSLDGVKYAQKSPATVVCSEVSPCPLVVEIPSDGKMMPPLGNPWLLLQGQCPDCNSELGVFIVVPQLQNRTVFTNEVVDMLQHLVRGLLTNPAIDQDRVFLTGEGMGADIAFRTGIRYPQLFSTVVLSGKFRFTERSMAMVEDKTVMSTAVQGKLKSIQIHFGEEDHGADLHFFPRMKHVLSKFEPGTLLIDIRVYPESRRDVWYAAWNVLHDFLWTGAKRDTLLPLFVPLSCKRQATASAIWPARAGVSEIAAKDPNIAETAGAGAPTRDGGPPRNTTAVENRFSETSAPPATELPESPQQPSQQEPAQQLPQQPPQQAQQQPVREADQQPQEQQVQQPFEEPPEHPVQQKVLQPTQQAVPQEQQPAQQPAHEPPPQPVQQPIERSPQQPVPEPAPEAQQQAAQQSFQESPQPPRQESAPDPDHQPSQQPVQQATLDPPQQAAPQAAQQAPQQQVQEQIQQPSQQTAQQQVEATDPEPLQQPAQQLFRQPRHQPMISFTDGPQLFTAAQPPSTDSAQPSETFGGPAPNSAGTAPNSTSVQWPALPSWWLLKNEPAGDSDYPCGFSVPVARLPACTQEVAQPFVEMSEVLRVDPGSISDMVDEAVLLGWAGPSALVPCTQKASETRSGYASRRLVIDAQYSNTPRCCGSSELPILTNQNVTFPKYVAAVSAIERRVAHGVEYVQISPSLGICTQDSPCPLVIQLPEKGEVEVVESVGNPWILMQGQCTSCQQELRSVLVAPALPDDAPKGLGMSQQTVRQKLVRLVESLLRDNPQIDRKRVYLVAQGASINSALRAAILRPDVFTAGFFSGMFKLSDDVLQAAKESLSFANIEGEADPFQPMNFTVMQFHIGDIDKSVDATQFFASLKSIVDTMGRNLHYIDIRVYPSLGHAVWYAAWNSLHEVLWTAQRWVDSIRIKVPTTCRENIVQ